MKKWQLILISIFICTFLALAFLACEEEEDNNDSSNVDPPDVGDDHTAEGYEGVDLEDDDYEDEDFEEAVTYGKKEKDDPTFIDEFGWSVAIDGDYAIVGIPGDDTAGLEAGAACIYHRVHGMWRNPALINALDLDTYSRFGLSVDISGDYAIVGAPKVGGFGVAYIYHQINTNSWIIDAKLLPHNLENGSFLQFGYKVAIDGDYAIVGSYGEGAAYVFHRTGKSTWDEGTRITTVDEDDYGFGLSVEIKQTKKGHYAVVGAPWNSAVFVFLRTGTNAWENETKIPSPYTDQENFYINFGHDVALDDEYLVVGSPSHNPYEVGPKVFLYKNSAHNEWDMQTIIVSPLGDEYDFGVSVDIDYPYIIVGDSHTDVNDIALAGAAYIFKLIDPAADLWETTQVVAFDPKKYDLFGHSVGISGDWSIIGAPVLHEGAMGYGAVYFHKFK